MYATKGEFKCRVSGCGHVVKITKIDKSKKLWIEHRNKTIAAKKPTQIKETCSCGSPVYIKGKCIACYQKEYHKKYDKMRWRILSMNKHRR